MTNYNFKQVPVWAYQFLLVAITGVILGTVIVIISPWAAFAGVGLILAIYLVLKMPELGILGIIIFTSTFLPVEANLGISIGIGHIYLTDILLFTLLTLIILYALVKPDFKLIATPLDFPLLAFVGIAFLSTTIAILYFSLTLQQSLGEIRNIANYLIFFVVTNLVRTKKQIDTLINGLLMFSVFVAIAMVIQYILGPFNALIPGRVEELWTEGATFSDVTRIIPPGYSLVFVGFVFLSVRQFLEKYNPSRLWILIPWILTGLGVLLTFKRHFWVAIIFIFLLLIYISKKDDLKRIVGWVSFGLIVSAVGIFLTIVLMGQSAQDLLNGSIGRLLSLTDASTYTSPDSSLRWRDFEYQYALPQIIAHPALGLGLGALYRPFVPYRDSPTYDGRGFIHNAHVWIMVKTGLLGYLAMLCVIALVLYRGFRYWNTLSTKWAKSVVLGLTLAYMGMLIGSIVEPMLIEWRWTALLAIMIGLNENILRLYSDREKLLAK